MNYKSVNIDTKTHLKLSKLKNSGRINSIGSFVKSAVEQALNKLEYSENSQVQYKSKQKTITITIGVEE